MICLSPADTELGWDAVLRNLEEIPGYALKIWRDAGILMPDETAEELKLDAQDALLAATAAALGLPVAEVYPARSRIHWMTFTDTPDLRLPLFVSLDGGPPRKLTWQA